MSEAPSVLVEVATPRAKGKHHRIHWTYWGQNRQAILVRRDGGTWLQAMPPSAPMLPREYARAAHLRDGAIEHHEAAR